MKTDNQTTSCPDHDLADRRRHARYKLKVKITVHSRSCGLLEGCTADISESGISAILRIEVPVGELVELEFILPLGHVNIYAMVRQRNAFRYGFQFLESELTKDREIIQATCRELSVEQSLLGEL